jgi:hypothetical protein
MIYLHNTTLFTPEKKLDQGALVISGETIAAFGCEDELPCPTDAESIDLGGLILTRDSSICRSTGTRSFHLSMEMFHLYCSSYFTILSPQAVRV